MTGPDFPFDNTNPVTAEKIMSTEFPRFNRICGATFKEHCQFPDCDCDHINTCRCEVCRFWS